VGYRMRQGSTEDVKQISEFIELMGWKQIAILYGKGAAPSHTPFRYGCRVFFSSSLRILKHRAASVVGYPDFSGLSYGPELEGLAVKKGVYVSSFVLDSTKIETARLSFTELRSRGVKVILSLISPPGESKVCDIICQAGPYGIWAARFHTLCRINAVFVRYTGTRKGTI
jgi:hypothetical protein